MSRPFLRDLAAFMLGMVFLALLIAISQSNRRCHHDGQLEHIDLPQTWRVRFHTSEEMTIILGVCKKCGRLTDFETTDPSGATMRFPLAGNPSYDEGEFGGHRTQPTPAKQDKHSL